MALGNSFDPQAIFEGMKTREKLRETPDTFGTRNGVGQQSNTKNLSDGQRMAIDWTRNETLKSNPQEDQAMMDWMRAFSLSPGYGQEWNDAKNNGMSPYINQGEGGNNMPTDNMDTMASESDSQTMEMEEA